MTDARPTARLEALSDGVFAIAMTLLILDVRLPSTAGITGTAELWGALGHLAPSVFAFVLSFGIILITWVSHHATLALVDRSSARFIYANGFLLLTVVAVPFTTGLLGDFLGTDHAGPAVVLYNAVLAVQAIGWILVDGAALKDRLATGEWAIAMLRNGRRNGYVAALFYALLAVAALRAPVASALVTTVSWIFWLILGIRMQRA
ncbi:MAG TPA: TMEM175 family protein [Gemmatimonadales bacterium]|nr:TMEM175 family protein [Gemmatimonadales bacterium]